MTQVRCAIYTRKSTDEGLEQDFNSLDAQREACEAFIRSQRGLGWTPLAARYDDGGYSGGTMDRPGLRSLLADIEGGKVDLIVVYKVDRLTRALSDFAKLVETFDAHGVSFVSVTQPFNTTTSMGRLTLNVLLSFAQFEREVTGERIRDKIAVSKTKGMWMGGLPPLGYDVRDRKLVVNPAEAETVRTIFRRYLELGTVPKLLDEAARLGLVTKRRTRSDGTESGGRPFTRGHLYQLLANPIYVGEIAHRGATYPGQHDAIIDRPTFDAVCELLDRNGVPRSSTTNAKAPSLLAGLVFDETGDRLSPTYANKRSRRYRYYVSMRLIRQSRAGGDGWRVPAHELEDLVAGVVLDLLRDRHCIIDALHLDGLAPDRLRAILARASEAACALKEGGRERRHTSLRVLLRRVTLEPDALVIEIARSGLAELLEQDAAPQPDQPVTLRLPITLKRRGVEAKLIIRTAQGEVARPDESLITLLSKAHRWLDELAAGTATPARAIASREGVDPGDFARTIQLAFLAPDIVEAIVQGRQPIELTPRHLKRIGTLPLDWHSQRRLLGFSG